MTERYWKVGELARETGLTVRALHHYDQIGLLSPSGRTDAGYRLYAAADVKRLYTIVALRELQLSLEEIRTALDAGVDIPTLMRKHLDHVEGQIEAAQVLQRRLTHALESMTPGGNTIDDYLQILEGMAMYEKYYTGEQLAALQKRRDALGSEGMAHAQNEWAELIAAVRAEHAAGTDPADPRMHELALRWRGLIEQFTGGDEGIHASLTTMYRKEGPERASRGGVDAELMAYVGRALEATNQRE